MRRRTAIAPMLAAIVALGGGLLVAIPASASAGTPTVTEVSLSPSNVVAGSPVTGTLQLSASSPVTATAVGIAVRDSSGGHYDFPYAASNVSLGTSTYTYTSGSRTFPAGTYSEFGFWQDTSGVYHNLPAITLTVKTAATTVTEVSLSPSNVVAGSSVTGTLQLSASSPVTATAVGIAVRDSAGGQYDFPYAASNVSLGTSTYTYTSGSRTFPAGTYSEFGFWQDTSGVYHNLPAITLTVEAAVAPSGPVPGGVPGTWNLKQADEFNGTSLNTTMWQAGWFGSGVTGPVNSNEVACYNSGNVTFPGDGSVHLKVTSAQSTCGGSTRPYTGALLSSNPLDGRPSGGYQYTYGVVEARVYLPPSGTSVANWPAVWADGQNWPTTGEDDIMEGLSGQACFHFISSSGAPGSCAPGNYAGWHTFASDWEPGSVTYYYDGMQVGVITSGVTASPMYLILDNTVTSSAGSQTVSPAEMQVDYIRVWQH